MFALILCFCVCCVCFFVLCFCVCFFCFVCFVLFCVCFYKVTAHVARFAQAMAQDHLGSRNVAWLKSKFVQFFISQASASFCAFGISFSVLYLKLFGPGRPVSLECPVLARTWLMLRSTLMVVPVQEIDHMHEAH